MTNTSKTVVFFGTDSFSAPALQALIEAGYSIGAVITKPDSKQGRGQQLTAPVVKTVALEHGIPVLQPLKLEEVIEDIKKFGPIVGVLSSYGKIVPQSIIDLFEPGIINIHPSLLPKYRGPSPIESAIAGGDKETGVSIMQLDAAMDAGPIYAQRQYLMIGNETQPQLYETLAKLGSELLIEVLPEILDGSLAPEPQKGEPTYSHLLKKEDAWIDPTTLTAVEAEQRIRGHLLFPRSKVELFGQVVIITKAHAVASSYGEPGSIEIVDDLNLLMINTVNGSLCIDALIPENKKEMPIEAFLRGYRPKV